MVHEDDSLLACSFSNLLCFTFRNMDRVHRLSNDMEKMWARANEVHKYPEPFFKTSNFTSATINAHKKKINANTKVLNEALNMIHLLRSVFDHIKVGLYDFRDKSFYKDERGKLETIGSEAIKKVF